MTTFPTRRGQHLRRLTAIVMLGCLAFNILVGWHMHTLKPLPHYGPVHAASLHGAASVTPDAGLPVDVPDRSCKATKHCPCTIACMGFAGPALHDVVAASPLAQDPLSAFRSRFPDIPLHPPNA